jgi:hypothetical protein
MNAMKPERCVELGPTSVGDFVLLGTIVHHYSPPTSDNFCGKIPLIIQCINASNAASDLDSNTGAKSSRGFRLLLQTYREVLSRDNSSPEYRPFLSVSLLIAQESI